MTETTGPNGNHGSDGEAISLPARAIPAEKRPSPAGAVFLKEIENLPWQEAAVRRIRFFDALNRDVFAMAEQLAQDPRETLADIMQALDGRTLPKYTSTRRSLRVQYVPSAHLQKFAGELLSTAEIVHVKLSEELAKPDVRLKPEAMVRIITQLLDRIIQIKGIVLKAKEEGEDADSDFNTARIDAMTTKLAKLNRQLEQTEVIR